MGGNPKKGKVVCSLVLLLLLCTALLVKDKREPGNNGETPVVTTPTPTMPMELHNVWLVSSEKETVDVLYDGTVATYQLVSPLKTKIQDCVVDLTVEEGKVTSLTVKQDRVEARVLRIGEDYVELEGYGCVALEDNSRVYRMYDGVEEKSWQDVLVGYTTSEFIISGDRICAALIQKPVEVTNIRVLLQTSSYGGYYHDRIECGSDIGFYLSDGSSKTIWKEGGEKVEISPELVEEYGGRIYLGTQEKEGRLSLYNVRRAVGVPSYRGTLEVALFEGKLVVVNELSLEEYLYGVLPSEMPESFGAEALKAQAVCARSYACNQLMANRYYRFGAHVDDSMNCQVYQNYGETKSSIEAVKATFGKILSREGECITAYYFSCSYGHTSDSYDIWEESTGTLLDGVMQAEGKAEENLENNENFKDFLNSNKEWYDAESVWFRWNTVIGSELDEKILLRLKERQKAVPDAILKKVSESGGEIHFDTGEVEKFGTLEDIIIAERGESGIIKKLILVGSEATYLIRKEYNIRYVLAPLNAVYLKDGSTTENVSLLPSAYFTLKKEENYFVLYGGGHGHGAGMSQHGAKYLAKKGYTYEEILSHYYKDVAIAYLYR